MAAEEDVETKSSQRENILYDLSCIEEWKFENEQLARSTKEKPQSSLIGRASSIFRRTAWTFLRTVRVPVQMPTPCLLPEQLVKLRSSENGWQIAVSCSGNWVAIAQDGGIEIRSQMEGLGNFYSRGALPFDPHPQWRCMIWSEDETMVVCSHSSGSVHFFDIMGSELFVIPGARGEIPSEDLSDAVAALIFTDYKPKEEKWTFELLVINHHGSLTSYLVDRDNGFKARYTTVLGSEYPRGISSVVYDAKHCVLFVGGAGVLEADSGQSKARQEGLTAWRLLSDSPFCKLITDLEEDLGKAQTKPSFMSKLRLSTLYQWNAVQVDGIYRISMSPCGSTLVALHFSGKLSVWHVPSLRLTREFELKDQPDWEEISPDFTENPVKKKRIKDLIPHKQLLDVKFWSEDLLILARCTGAVSIVSPETLHNLLGKSPEWYEPAPKITEAQNGGFLGLECEIRFPKKKIIMSSGEDEDDDDSDDEDASLMARTTRMSKDVLFYLTDFERFQPPMKKPRLVTKVQRIVHLKSTTPEELYAKKIDAEEYGEALALAQAYNLDCDLVYQRQWRKADVSYASIQDYLSKISKRSWVLHECLERVPDGIDAMKELLEYGLNGTDLPALIAVGNGEDGGRFILCDPDEGLYEDIYDKFNPESVRQREEKRKEIRQELLEQVDFANLNLEQKELCRARLKFLQYLYRLKTYECILGGPIVAFERFNSAFFASFRSRSIYELAAEYAQNSDWKALETLMTFHSEELAPHRLAILSNFPETTNPEEYKSLLPEIGDEDDVVPWEVDSWRELDWAEDQVCRAAVSLGEEEDEAAFLYENFPQKFRAAKLYPSLVESWYQERAMEIERCARLVDFSTELIRLGIERGVENLRDLLDELVTLDMLVYDCGVGIELSLEKLRDMADYDRLEMMMSKSSEEMYFKNLRRWMVPFLQRCEQKESGAYDRLLRDFILTRSRDDLSTVLKIFEASKPGVQSPVIGSQTELISLVLDTLYSCERDDQLETATKIFECLPARYSDHSGETAEQLRLSRQVDSLDQHLSVAKIFQVYDMKKTLAYIKASENEPDEAKSLMIKLTRYAGKRSLPLTEMEWYKLHDDVLLLQNKVYRCISRSVCHEIFVESLMCSGKQDTIRLAGTMLERSCTETKPSRSQRGASVDKVPYTRAVELALSAAREYFDSSANLNDPCMDLARSCLNLILDAPGPIQAELDLIASLALLDEFGVAILPLQVRLSKDRLDLVKKAVLTKPTSYKQTARLLRLGQLLGISSLSENERTGKIVQMAAEAAVTALDYDFAFQCCERLIELCHSDSWSVCVKLAEQEGFRNISAKAQLLSFALTYCDAEMIQPVLQARILLETQILYEQVNKAVTDSRETENNTSNSADTRESPFSARAAIQQTQNILSSTRKTTSAVLSTVTDAKWWQKAVKSLKHPDHSLSDKEIISRQDDGNANFNKQGCHPFYASIIEDCYEDWSSADYTSWSAPKPSLETSLSTNMLRTAKLEEKLTQGKQQQPASEALLELARQTVPRDATLGLAYLMATPKEFDVSSCFEAFPSTDISLQLAVYYYALRVYSALKPVTAAHVYALYRQSPTKIIGRVVDFVESHSPQQADWPPEVSDLIEKMRNYQEMLEDYNQACTLQKLGKGVDVIRFAEDADYKKETIFGLAMCVEEDVYQLSLSLAQRYNLPMWDVYMTHLEFLFTDSGLSMEEVQNRVNRYNLVTTLKERQKEFTQRMITHVYPFLAGNDLKGLSYFFNLLDAGTDKICGELTPAEHIALLKKLKSTNSDVDYKQLTDEITPPMDVLQPCLTSANINTMSKLAAQIPNKCGGYLHASDILSAWAGQVFWLGEDKKKPPPEAMSGWVHRYESIGEWIQKLRPEGLVSLVDSLVFTPSAREKLDVPTRDEITKRALKFSRQTGGGKKKKQEDTGSMTWEECSQQLQTRLNHLRSLTNDTIQSFAQADNPTFSSYAQRYDLSKGNFEEVELLLVQMILDGQAVDLVEDVLQIAPPSSLKTRTVVQQAVTHIATALKGEEVSPLISVSSPWLEVLQKVVENVREHQENWGELVTAEDVMSLLRSFCSDSSIEVIPRLDVLKVLEKSFDLSEDDRVLLTLYRTDALVSSTWEGIQMSEDQIISEESRLALFESLLGKCESKDHYLAISRILNLWPEFSESASLSNAPWRQLFSQLISDKTLEVAHLVSLILREECQVFPLNKKDTEHIYHLLVERKLNTCAVKLVLRSPRKDLLDKALSLLAEQDQGLNDKELLNLILEKNLTTRLVSTQVYPELVTFILESQGQDDTPPHVSPTQVASQFKESGFEAEAGSLLYQARSSHGVLQTFSSALATAKAWMQKS